MAQSYRGSLVGAWAASSSFDSNRVSENQKINQFFGTSLPCSWFKEVSFCFFAGGDGVLIQHSLSPKARQNLADIVLLWHHDFKMGFAQS